MTNQPDELVIDDSNFEKYFRDCRNSKPERGDVIARFTSAAEFIDGRLKRDLINVLKTPGKAFAATNVMRKLGCAIELDSYRICKEMTQDIINGMTDDEVAEKVYKYQIEGFYYTKAEYVPTDDPHWCLISIKNLDEFLDSEGTKLESNWKFVDGKQPEAIDTADKNLQ